MWGKKYCPYLSFTIPAQTLYKMAQMLYLLSYRSKRAVEQMGSMELEYTCYECIITCVQVKNIETNGSQ